MARRASKRGRKIDGEKPAIAHDRTAPKKGPKGSNVGSTYELLRNEIVSMQLRPGEVLDEVGLSKRLKLSRSPIREALIRLASEGLVTVLPNRSTVVSTLDLQSVPKFLDALELMQRVVTRLAALNWTAEQLAKIKGHEADFLDSLRQGDLGRMLSANYDYHMAIAAAADNRYFSTLYGRLLDEGKRLLRKNFDLEVMTKGRVESVLVREHADITMAIENRDADEAERLGYLHAVQFRRRVLQFLETSEAGRMTVAFDQGERNPGLSS